MSDCNCKNKSIDEMLDENGEQISRSSNSETIIKYSLKILAFLFMLVLLPLINLAIIWYIFNMFVLNKNIDVKPILTFLGKKFQEKDEPEDDDIEYDKLTEDDVILLDVQEITNE